jgi:Na+:H+ antiporter
MSPTTAIEFLIWLLIAASLIAVIATRIRIPYTVALVLGGLLLGSVRIPLLESIYQSHRPDWLNPEIVFILFLPPLLFEGSLKVNVKQLKRNLIPVLLLANLGVLAATIITGYVLHWEIGLPLTVALLFGAIISATDPISVLAIFKDLSVAKRLSLLVEGESLLNDGTAVVLFQILLAGIVTGNLNIAGGIGEFVESVLGGALIGFALGYTASKLTSRIDDPQIEITLTTILAYSSFLLAHRFHLSGVIATVVAGMAVGNLGTKTGMSARTRLALWSFWEYASFVINSLVFLLIGMEVKVSDLLSGWRPILLGVLAVVVGRALSVYSLTPISNFFTEKIPLRWQHILVWGGLHGSLSLALALSIPQEFPHRETILTLTFGVVAFSIVVQGLTIKTALTRLKLSSEPGDDDYVLARVQQIAISSARGELDELSRSHVISGPAYDVMRKELDDRQQAIHENIATMYTKNAQRANEELRTARLRLLAAEKSAIEDAVHDGLISTHAAARLIDTADHELDAAASKHHVGDENEP